MADEARISQFVTIIVGETPPTLELTPGAVSIAGGVPAVTLGIALTPSPVAVLASPLVVSLLAPGDVQPDPVVLSALVPDVLVTFTDPPPEPPVSCVHETQPAYLAMLQQLLPRGSAWTREPEAVLTALLAAIASELSCIDRKARELLEETDPRFTLEMLPDWERAFGLPDECTGTLETIQERRAALLARVANQGGASPAYFEALLASLGYPEARVVEYLPFVVGRSRVGDAMTSPQKAFRVGSSVVGDALTNMEGWLYTWAIYAPNFSFRYFRVGLSTVGEPLRTWGNSGLECLIEELKPAHTLVLYFYFVALRPDPVIATLDIPSVVVS